MKVPYESVRGTAVSMLILSYVQDNIGWSIGFGIPCILMAIAPIVFLVGTNKYRHCLLMKNPFGRVRRSFFVLSRSWMSKFKGQTLTINVELIKEAKEILRLIPIWSSGLIYVVANNLERCLQSKEAL